MPKVKLITVFVTSLAFCLFTKVTFADIGPKPTSVIYVSLYGKPIKEPFQARMLACSKYLKLWYDEPYSELLAPTEKGSYTGDLTSDMNNLLIRDLKSNCYWRSSSVVWGGDCVNSKCFFNYFLPDKFVLAVRLPDTNRLYLSDPTERKDFNSHYTADITKGGKISIADTSNLVSSGTLVNFILAFIATVLIEICVVTIFFQSTPNKNGLFAALLIGNLISVPLVWFVGTTNSYLFLGEVGAVIVEFIIYKLATREQVGNLKLIIFTMTANLVSFVCGLFINALGFTDSITQLVLRISA